MRSPQANALRGEARLSDQPMPIRQWLFVLVGILMVAVPWWLGMLWILGALN